MQNSKKNVPVAAGIIWREGRFLAARRPEGKARAGYWEFPGGKREPGESMEEALRRELFEELSIRCGRVRPWHINEHEYTDIRVELHFMHVLDFTGEPRPNDGQELRWVSPDEARDMNFLPADAGVVQRISPPAELLC